MQNGLNHLPCLVIHRRIESMDSSATYSSVMSTSCDTLLASGILHVHPDHSLGCSIVQHGRHCESGLAVAGVVYSGMQPHHVYSPRKMIRWVRGICEAIQEITGDSICLGLVCLWAEKRTAIFFSKWP